MYIFARITPLFTNRIKRARTVHGEHSLTRCPKSNFETCVNLLNIAFFREGKVHRILLCGVSLRSLCAIKIYTQDFDGVSFWRCNFQYFFNGEIVSIAKFVRCEISQITALWSEAKIGKVSVPLSVAKTTCFPSVLRHKLIIQFINPEDMKQDSRTDAGSDLLRVYDKREVCCKRVFFRCLIIKVLTIRIKFASVHFI